MATLFLCGDVMTGRAVDQILPFHCDPELREPWVRDAREYVALAEERNGPIPRPVGFDWIWGDALEVLEEHAPAARVINLETSITTRADFWPGKGIHYRMHPANVPCLTAAGIDVAVLGNNHVLDFGREGLRETLAVLHAAGIRTAGAGLDAREAVRPAVLALGAAGRLLVWSFGTLSSGVPPEWAAGPARPGVCLLEPDARTAAALTDAIAEVRRPGDLVIVSIHWGSNWGYGVPDAQVEFARALVEGGVDVVHGHSSHHPRPLEIHRDRLILYGCGDLLNDYEGIRGHEAYRDDLVLMYLPKLDPIHGLEELVLVPMQLRNMRLNHPSPADAQWLAETLDRISRPFGARIELATDGSLRGHW